MRVYENAPENNENNDETGAVIQKLNSCLTKPTLTTELQIVQAIAHSILHSPHRFNHKPWKNYFATESVWYVHCSSLDSRENVGSSFRSFTTIILKRNAYNY